MARFQAKMAASAEKRRREQKGRLARSISLTSLSSLRSEHELQLAAYKQLEKEETIRKQEEIRKKKIQKIEQKYAAAAAKRKLRSSSMTNLSEIGRKQALTPAPVTPSLRSQRN